jgi:cobalt/nickel transport system permease protein
MSDALLSPAVGGAMWVAGGAAIAYSAKKIGGELDSRRVPLMGVLAAFVFAGQMINFTIPGTGSSGHLGGGVMLAVLLGPHAAFLAMASILTVQALFFADGGLLALGCNIFNLGFFPAFVAFPLLFRPLAGKDPTPARLSAASVAAAVAGLLLGALAVVVQTVASGITELPFATFASIMLPIHLVIGIVEGLVTAAVVSFIWKARPEVLQYAAESEADGAPSFGRIIAGLAAAAVVTGGGLSWFASTQPDGLEWSILRVSGKEELRGPQEGVPARLGDFQEKTALLPGYSLLETVAGESEERESWPAVSPSRSLSGMVGGLLTLALAVAVGYAFRRRPQ